MKRNCQAKKTFFGEHNENSWFFLVLGTPGESIIPLHKDIDSNSYPNVNVIKLGFGAFLCEHNEVRWLNTMVTGVGIQISVHSLFDIRRL